MTFLIFLSHSSHGETAFVLCIFIAPVLDSYQCPNRGANAIRQRRPHSHERSQVRVERNPFAFFGAPGGALRLGV